jgi:DNA-binding XRE family transcriptional regulator
MHPGGKEREALKESIHVRIVAAIRIEQEPPRNFWILARKLAAHLA